MKRVVIIGAGPCGLAALKEMRASGHEAILFERSATLGGIFASTAIYPDLHLTISNWAMAFSDFPDPERLCYPSAQSYLQYLQSYARHFDLERYISYNSEVSSAMLLGDISDGRCSWSLEVRQIGRKDVLSVQADALIVATGANHVPTGTPPGLSGFSGRILHSVDYDEAFKREVAEKRLRVLIVGGGESAADVSQDLGDLSPHISVWLRRPMCVGPRYLVSDSEMQQVAANKEQDFPANAFLEAATTNRMSAAQNVFAYGFFRRILWHTSVLNRTLSRVCLDSTSSAFFMNDQATYVTKNQRMCESLHEKKIEMLVSPNVSAHEQTVDFRMRDGTVQQRDFDVIMLCTGFRTDYPWLKLKEFDSNPRSWFLHCFPEGLGHCLFFVGYARPHQGGIPIMAEMLSRYIALLLRGERRLPFGYAAQAGRDKAAEREHFFLSPDLHTLVDYNAFIESVARRVGCEPRLPVSSIVVFNLHMLAVLMLLLGCLHSDLNLLGRQLALLLWASTMSLFFVLNDGVLIKWWFYPHWAVWYRQRGPGADHTLPERVLRRVNIWKATAITRGFVLLVFWSVPTFYAQRFLSLIMFMPHIILTTFGLRFRKSWGGLLRPILFSLHGTKWRISDLFLP